MSWGDFESAVVSGDETLSKILDTSLATGGDNSLALRLTVLLNGASFHDLFVRAHQLEVSRTGDGHMEVASLDRLGREYWEAWQWNARKSS